MQIYWTRNQIPELRDRTAEQRYRIWRSAFAKAWRHWEMWLYFLVYMTLVMLLAQLGSSFGYRWIGLGVGIFLGTWVLEHVIVYVTRRYHPELLNS